MSNYRIPQPEIYKNDWLIFPNTTLSNIDLSDCNDSIDGVCRHTDNIQQCIDICDNDDTCEQGYFIKSFNKNYCVPLRKLSSIKEVPYFRYRYQNIYPQLEGQISYTFANKKIYPYPPDMANALFYNDHFLIQNKNTSEYIGIPGFKQKFSEKVVFSKDSNKGISLTILPSDMSLNYSKGHMIVQNEANIVFNIPNTAIILRHDNNNIKWLVGASIINVPNNTFKIHSVSNNKLISFDDEFYLTFQGNVVSYDQTDKKLVVLPVPYSKNVQNNNNIIFRMIPKIKAYYCDNKICKSVELDKTTGNGLKSFYNGKMVYRSPTCWNQCNNFSDIPILIILILMLLVLIYFLNRRY